MKDLGDVTGWYDEYIEARDSSHVSAVFRELKTIDADPMRIPSLFGVRIWNTIAQDNDLTHLGKRAVGFWSLGRDQYTEKFGQEKADEEELATRKFFDFAAWIKWKNRLRGFGPLSLSALTDIGAEKFGWMPVEGEKEKAFREELNRRRLFYEPH